MIKHLAAAVALVMCLRAQNHSHSQVQTSKLPIVDGSRNPELVTDDMATRVLIVSLM